MKAVALDRVRGCLGILPLGFLIYIAAVWLGCFCAACSLLVGGLVGGRGLDLGMFVVLIFSPLLLVSESFCFNGAVLAIAAFLNWRLEGGGPRFWGVFAGMEAFIVTLGWLGELDGPAALASCFGTLAVMIGMMSVGIWFFRQWWFNRWAGELAMQRAANAQRYAEREERKKRARSREGTRS